MAVRSIPSQSVKVAIDALEYVGRPNQNFGLMLVVRGISTSAVDGRATGILFCAVVLVIIVR